MNVNLNPKNGKIVANEREQSSASHIYAIGDMLDGKPELTPVAIQVHNSDVIDIQEICFYKRMVSVDGMDKPKRMCVSICCSKRFGSQILEVYDVQ